MVLVGVSSIEIIRFIYYMLYAMVEKIIADFSGDHLPLNDVSSSFAAGVGWSAIHSIIFHGSTLSNSYEPAGSFSASCTLFSADGISAISSCLSTFQSVSFMMLAFAGWKKKEWRLNAYVVVAHFTSSLSTLFNSSSWSNGCILSLLISLVVASFSVYLTAKTVQRFYV
eukprot:g871.t1